VSRLGRLRDDSGIYAIVYGLLVVVVVVTAAIVVDLSSMREDRRAERLASDAAATAGAVKLNALAGVADAQAACQEAWRFLKVNLPGASGAITSCPTGSFPSSFSVCPSTARAVTAAAGPWEVTITWPVPDGDTLMTDPNISGRGSYQQPIDPEIDGADPCARLGVSVARDRQFVFAGAGGFVDGVTSNDSVARAELRGQTALEFPLVVLDQSGCRALSATGSSPSGAGIIVQNNGITPGRIALDSAGNGPGNNAPGCANSNSYVAEASGGSRIVAWDGTSGAAGAILSYGPPSKAASPAQLCSAGTSPNTVTDRICPAPQSFLQITRKYWDWQYHCTTATAAPLSAPCPYTAPGPTYRPDYISQHRARYAATVLTAANAVTQGFTVISDCSPGAAYTYFDPGNYYVNCAKYSVGKTVVFGGGTVVFKGDVEAKGQGSGLHCLVFNQEVGMSPTKDAAGFYRVCGPTSSADLPDTDDDAMNVYLQNGSFSRQNADLIAPQTFIYQESSPSFGGSPSVRINLGTGTSGGSGVTGTLFLTAPTTGPFANLALWTENPATSTDPNALGAQTNIALEGIFFVPNGQVEFSGNATYLGPPRAQFVAWRLSTVGGSQLIMVPDADRTLTIPVGGVRLIR
jgi:hypothetical protein